MNAKPLANPAHEVIASDEGFVIHDAAGAQVHYLNETAAIVFSLCDGQRTLTEIAALVGDAFGLEEAPVADVEKVVTDLTALGVLTGPT
ncbi:MAG: PqqD family protein [Acidimicrobiales bacterium]